MNELTETMEGEMLDDGMSYVPEQYYEPFSELNLELDTNETYPASDQTFQSPPVVQAKEESKSIQVRSSGILCRLRRKLTENHGNEAITEKSYTWSFELLEFENVENDTEIQNSLSTGDTAPAKEIEDDTETLQLESCTNEINLDGDVSDKHVPKIAHNVPINDSKEVKPKSVKINKRNGVNGKETTLKPNQFIKQGYINTINRYRCKHCDFSCKLGCDLITHIQKKHKVNLGPYKCSECGCTTKNLVQHMRVLHTNLVQIYKCQDCNYSTSVKAKLSLHAKVAHKGRSEVNRSCVKESETKCIEPSLVSGPMLVVDTKTEPDRTNEYEKSSDTIKPKITGSFPVVRRKRNSSNNKHKCSQCDYATRWKKNLIRHVTTKHDDHADVYKCEECDYTAKIKANLSQHVRVKHDATAAVHQCTECDYMTKLRKNLLRHVRVMHDATTNVYSCPKCEYVTKVKRRLQEHTSAKHVSSEGSYKCAECSYATDVNDDFVTHVKIMHNGEPRVHKCDWCDYTTKWRKNLLRHVRLLHDLNTKVFQCTRCDYSTKVEKTFAMHMDTRHRLADKTHGSTSDGDITIELDDNLLKIGAEIESELYKCNHCDYETKWKKNLPRHISSRHKSRFESYKYESGEQVER